MAKNLWGGRFKGGMDPRLMRFSYSLATDYELFHSEIAVNTAYVKMLNRIKILTAAEMKRLLRALKTLEKSAKPGDVCRNFDKFEDVHTYIQDQLEHRGGPVADKIHTGRSRNDLVVTSTRYYLKARLNEIQQKMALLQKALVASARKAGEAIVPGMTHLKKAQPVLVAHHFLAYVEMLEEDGARLKDSNRRLDVLPLGSAALAGSSLPLDQKYLAKQLGFSRIAGNSMAAVSDRAFLTEIMTSLAILWMHLSRFSEDMILWNSEPFGFIDLNDAFATGSSLMPQKKNPDVFELIRGKSAAIFGGVMTLLGLQKGLPLAYNRDLQEDKKPVFDAIHQTLTALDVLAPTVKSLQFKREAMENSVQDDGLYATDIAEYLVRKKVSFREAHTAVGQVVRHAAEKGVALRSLPFLKWKKFSKHFDSDVYDLFNAKKSVRAKKTVGSTNPARVRSELQRWETRLRSRG